MPTRLVAREPREKFEDPEGLRALLDRLKCKRPPVVYTGARKNIVWAQPTLIAEVEYRARTLEGKLRHASYKGVRDVQDNAEVYRLC